MNDCKASKQNFDSSYIYKVEEREEIEKIVCHSDIRGLVSIETNELPKVTRYFLKNNEGQPQGYIERKLIRNFDPDFAGNEDKFDPQTGTQGKQHNPHEENTKMKTTLGAATLKGEEKLDVFDEGSKRFRRSNELRSPLNSAAFERRKNFRLDFPSSNSERTFNTNLPVSTADSAIVKNIKQQPMKGKSFAKPAAKKSQRLFCNDPNKRLKNLFTIIRPNEKINKNVNTSYDIELLNKTKGFLVKLIDDELQRVQPYEDATNNVKFHRGYEIDTRALKKLKLECIEKIEEELRLMRRLQI